MATIELKRQPSPERQPEHMWSLQAERVDERRKAIGIVGQAERLGRIRRPASAGPIPRHHRELVGQAIELPAPRPAVLENPVQEDERWPFAHPLEGDTQPSHLDLVHLVSQPAQNALGRRSDFPVWSDDPISRGPILTNADPRR